MATRILYVIDSLAPGGVVRQLSLAAEGLARTQFDLRVLAIQRPTAGQCDLFSDALRAAGMAVDHCGGRWPVDPRALARLRRLVRTWRPEVIHSWDRASSIYAHLALGAAASVRHVTSRRRWLPAHALPLLIDQRVMRAATTVITSSEVLCAEWRKHGVPADKLRVIPSGVREPTVTDCTREALLDELGLPRQARLFGCIGRLTIDKRVKDVIWATGLLKNIRDDVHLLIIGDGPHRARLEKFRDQVRAADKVHFLGLRVDVPRLLPHCEVLLAAGQTDFQSSSILEAMAAGVPVVASDTPGHRELIVSDMTGDLVPVGDRGAFTRKAMRVLDDTAVASRLAAGARARALNEFGCGRLASRHAEVYRGVLRQR